MSARGDFRHIDARLGSMLELLDELWQSRHSLTQHTDNRRCASQRVVEDTIEQILDRPGELPELARTNHASTALQGVERAAHRHQGFTVHRVLIPRREVALNLRQLLVCFLDEQLHQLGVGILRKRADHGSPRRRNDRGNRRSSDLRGGRIANINNGSTHGGNLHCLRER
jgi:hypothetical protein